MARIGRLLCSPAAAWAALSRKPFSLTAYDLANSLKRAGVSINLLVDVGANEGQFSRSIRATYGEGVSIIGFEPLRNAFCRLQANFHGDGRARFYRFALGSREATMEMHVNSFSQSSSLLKLGERHLAAFPGAREVGTEAVEVSRLDKLISGADLASPSLLKIDVQGYELEVLEGSARLLSKFDHVLVEIGLASMYAGEPTFDQVDTRLKSSGFRFVEALALLEHDGIAIQMDALYRRT